MAKNVGGSSDLIACPLPDEKSDKIKYVAVVIYQDPKRIRMRVRQKISPKFDTAYGLLYWLNKQPWHMEYFIFRTDKQLLLRSGYRKAHEVIK